MITESNFKKMLITISYKLLGLSLSASCKGLLTTSSNDGVFKILDVFNVGDPKIIHEKSTNLGAIQCSAASPNSPFVFAVGGDNKSHNFKIFDVKEIPQGNELL